MPLVLLLQVRESDLEQLCDGEGDAKGLAWPLHVRDRLPLDILKALPGALKAVSQRDGSGSSSGQRGSAAAEDAPEAGLAGVLQQQQVQTHARSCTCTTNGEHLLS
jgi:hypothetical protein